MLCRCFLVGLIIFHFSLAVFGTQPFDFDGDGKSDPTVFDSRSTGVNSSQLYWHVLQSNRGYSITQWGARNFNTGGYADRFVPGDYDGDGKTDYAIWRVPQRTTPSSQIGGQCYFYILYSSTGTYDVIPWGLGLSQSGEDTIAVADYDGDGKTDVAIARSDNASLTVYWWIRQSRDGLRLERWGGGISSGHPYPADYDGDGKADLTVVRTDSSGAPYTWYILRSSDGNWMTPKLGIRSMTFQSPATMTATAKPTSR